jgi:acyl-CoA thioesterase I
MSLQCCRFILILTVVAMLGLSCSSKEELSRSEREGSAPRPETPSLPVESDARPVIVTLGDSLTIGLGVDPEANFPSRLQKKLDEAGFHYRVVNAGVSGDTTAQGLNRLGAVLDQRPSVVVVALGANDGLRGLPVFNSNASLESIITALKAKEIDVVLAGMTMPPNYGGIYTREFREIFPALAKKHQIRLVPFLLEGVAGNPALNLEDGIHPNARGYEIITENVWKELRPLLK